MPTRILRQGPSDGGLLLQLRPQLQLFTSARTHYCSFASSCSQIQIPASSPPAREYRAHRTQYDTRYIALCPSPAGPKGDMYMQTRACPANWGRELVYLEVPTIMAHPSRACQPKQKTYLQKATPARGWEASSVGGPFR